MLSHIDEAFASEDFVLAEQMLSDLAVQNIEDVKTEITTLRKEGVVIADTTEYLDKLMQTKNYSDAILETEKCSEKNRAFETGICSGKNIPGKNITDPELIALYDKGNYTEFIQTYTEPGKRKGTDCRIKNSCE